MNYQNILANSENGILTITINRPNKLNALNQLTLSEIKQAVTDGIESETIKGMIINGSGEKAFVAGADISEFQGIDVDGGKKLAANGHHIFNLIENSPKPVIAAVNGFALGGGCELAMACHIRLAAKNAKFGQPEVNLGLIPGYGGTQRLIQLIGKGKAFELLMTADMIDAEEALRLGLVTHVVDNNELLVTSQKILGKILGKSPVAIAQVIKSVNAYFTEGVNGLEAEINAFANCCGTEDFIEGTTAFLEKRKANFPGK